MNQCFQVATRPIYQGKKPVRSARYLRFVKGFACAACRSTRGVDPCHTGAHGMSQKSPDTAAVPLCRSCHDSFDADPRGFAREHQLDIPRLIEKFNALWREKQKRSAA